MKRSNGSPQPAGRPVSPKRHAQLLAAFDRSGLSAAAFARRHRIHDTTFCGWRQRRSQASPGFVQVELSAPQARKRLRSDRLYDQWFAFRDDALFRHASNWLEALGIQSELQRRKQ